MSRKNLLSGLFLSIITVSYSFSESFVPNIYSDTSRIMQVNKNIYLLEDSTLSLNFEKIRNSSEFKKSSFDVPNLGVSNSTYWIKFSIKNSTKANNLLLQLSYPLMDIADLYIEDTIGGYQIIQAGDILPFSIRKFKSPNYIYEVKIRPSESKTLYMRLRAKEQILVPLFIGTPVVVVENNSIADIFIGIYIGIILAMFLYNSFILFTTKDINYLFYIIYIFFIGLTQISLLGYSSKLLWPDSLWLSNHGLFISAAIGSSAIAIFMQKFLHMAEFTPKLVYGVYVIVGIYILALAATLLDQYQVAYKIIDINGILITFFSLYVAAVIALKGYKPARYFLLGWTIFLIGVLVFVLRSFGLLPYNSFTNYTMPIGSAVEVILLSLALADRINILKKEKEASQLQALDALRANEKLITEQNVILENKVLERTGELEQANEELNATLSNLKDTQAQLVDAEKMASLGQLTAGIAHEINNPINFVSANIKPLKLDIADILEIIEKYETITPNNGLEEKLKEIEIFKKTVDLDYLKTEIETLLTGIEEGAKRTAEIVSGLKNFSRLDESEIKEANINDGIESTLVLLRSNVQADVEIVTNLGKLPYIECYPGKLNQVFMNILTNAFHAMMKKKPGKHMLTISSWAADDNVYVSFEDTGIGMSAEVKAKIFEPFFTTKDVGEGTGLGMSIVFKIIESHNGKIDIETEYGMGTKILLTLHKKLNLS